MPFMKGRAPVRRTIEYLQKGKLPLKSTIDVVSIHYNMKQDASKGALDFVFWYLPQLQYKNPGVQIVTFKNMTPSPFFQFFFKNGQKIVVDVDSKSKEEIHDFIQKSMCHELPRPDAEETPNKKIEFGALCEKQCICEIPGQVPCPGAVRLPNELRGKFRYNKEKEK